MPCRNTFSTSAWKMFACGTSVKSASHAPARVEDSPLGFVTTTS
jgi:hypothetical protein